MHFDYIILILPSTLVKKNTYFVSLGEKTGTEKLRNFPEVLIASK